MYSKLATKMSVAVELIDTREAERDEARQIAREACDALSAIANASKSSGEAMCARVFLVRPEVQRLMTMEGK
jgi:hypothetical protein